jgi:hypothetical protein
VEDRFKGNCKWVFSTLKRVTKYDAFDKRDGGIVIRAFDDEGNVLSGVRLEQAIMEDYSNIHG